mmetsp:Transcript_38386/g.80470  ORF Transcript_38386/g.80470 Transcript_38386/m.80470 type:complete len:90 (-) Transcript_38386:287-556(-)
MAEGCERGSGSKEISATSTVGDFQLLDRRSYPHQRFNERAQIFPLDRQAEQAEGSQSFGCESVSDFSEPSAAWVPRVCAMQVPSSMPSL